MSLLENIAAKIEQAREAIPSGQERTAWLRRQEEAVGNAIRPYVPPELRGTNALAALAEFSDAADMRDFYDYGGRAANALAEGDWWQGAQDAAQAGASGLAAFAPGISAEMLQQAAPSALGIFAGVKAANAPTDMLRKAQRLTIVSRRQTGLRFRMKA